MLLSLVAVSVAASIKAVLCNHVKSNVKVCFIIVSSPIERGQPEFGIRLMRHLNLHKSSPQVPVPNAKRPTGRQSVPLFN